MFTYLYEYFYSNTTDNQKELAIEQIQFLNDRKGSLYQKCNLSNKDRDDKIRRIDITIEALKYTYNL